MCKPKASRTLRLILSTVLLVMILAVAAFADAQANVSRSPACANLSTAALPVGENQFQAGEKIYVNIACTQDLKIKSVAVYDYKNGSYYKSIGNYTAKNYARYVAFPYYPDAGEHSIWVKVQWQSGYVAWAELKATVSAASTGSGTYYYGNTTYNTTANFKADYCYCQNNYSRFLNSSGRNTGCTGTAEATCYSISHNQLLTPEQVAWVKGVGAQWEYCQILAKAGSYTQADALQYVYQSITVSDQPVILGVKTSSGVDHVVTAVGIRAGADYNNLQLQDILIVDPWDGCVKTLASYYGVDTSWSLRISI